MTIPYGTKRYRTKDELLDYRTATGEVVQVPREFIEGSLEQPKIRRRRVQRLTEMLPAPANPYRREDHGGLARWEYLELRRSLKP